MQKSTPKKVDLGEIPEVVDFVDIQDTLAEFKEFHGAVFSEYAQLVAKYNSARESAEKACRQRRVGCGPFDLYQYQVRYDAEALLSAVGREQFLQLGGKMETKAQYTLDKNTFEMAASQGKVPEEVVVRVRKEVPFYHVPEKL